MFRRGRGRGRRNGTSTRPPRPGIRNPHGFRSASLATVSSTATGNNASSCKGVGKSDSRTSSSTRNPERRGLFQNSVWYCDCAPRLPAAHFLVRKEGPNQGRWFYTCQRPTSEGFGSSGCGFYMWDDGDAKGRAAVAAGYGTVSAEGKNVRETQPSSINAPPAPVSMTRKRKLPWPTYSDVDGDASESAQPASKSNNGIGRRAIHDTNSDEEFNDWPTMSRDETNLAMSRALASVEAQAEMQAAVAAAEADPGVFAASTSQPASPVTPRKGSSPTSAPPSVPSESNLETPKRHTTATSATGLPTPGTTPAKPTIQQQTRYTDPQTPTPARFTSVLPPISPTTPSTPSLTTEVFTVLSNLKPPLPSPIATTLRETLARHERRANGYHASRDMLRDALRTREQRFAELEGRVQELEGRIEARRYVGIYAKESDAAARTESTETGGRIERSGAEEDAGDVRTVAPVVQGSEVQEMQTGARPAHTGNRGAAGDRAGNESTKRERNYATAAAAAAVGRLKNKPAKGAGGEGWKWFG